MSTRSTPDIYSWNQRVWDLHVMRGQRWTRSVTPEALSRARRGDLSDLTLCASKPVPASWLPEDLSSSTILCLASGGGQQGALLAAAGAGKVVVYDASEKQLQQDRDVAMREGFEHVVCIQGDMRELDAIAASSIDVIVHPVSNCFVSDIQDVWRECHRVLKPGGALLSGFNNPVVYCYDEALWWEEGVAKLVHSVPYSDLEVRTPDELDAMSEHGEALEFGHSLESQLQGQCAAGFAIVGFYEDGWHQEEGVPEQFGRQNALFPAFMATRALKLHDQAPG